MKESRTYALLEIVAILIPLLLLLPYYFYTKEKNETLEVGLVGGTSSTRIYKAPQVAGPLSGVTAESYMLVAYDGNTLIPIVSYHENDARLLASMTKLMTALVAERVIESKQILTFSESDVALKGTSGFFKAGDSLNKKNALYSMLIESNNDSARLLASSLGTLSFVKEMNEEAQRLGMHETHYVNPSGLDGVTEEGSNRTSASDLTLLVKEYIDTNLLLLLATTAKAYPIYFSNTVKSHVATSTNRLLTDSTFPYTIVGGKTGETALAKQNLVLAVRPKEDNVILIGVVLHSENNFEDMKKLFKAYGDASR